MPEKQYCHHQAYKQKESENPKVLYVRMRMSQFKQITIKTAVPLNDQTSQRAHFPSAERMI